jgi:uncharacterized protein (TIGR03067 family)
MRGTVCLLATVMLVLPSLGSDSPKEYDGATARNELEGTWERVSATPAVGKTVIALPGECVETFRDGRWVYRNKGRLVSEGVYRADDTRRPCALDESTTAEHEAGITRRFIYRLEGDTLRTAFVPGSRECPKSFDETGAWVATWKRVAK